MATREEIDLMKQDMKRSFDPISLNHRKIAKGAIVEMFKRGITVKDVEPYFEGIKTDDEAKALFFACGVAEILAVETGRWDDDAAEKIWRLAHAISTAETETGALIDLVLERMPGSITYKRPN